jgi:ABC-type phosphate/phosphonate transport system ATPase subunit
MEIELVDLTVQFPGRSRPAVQAVTVTIPSGVRCALLGPSGSGKSTLLRALLGAVPARGRIRIGGRDPYGNRAEQRAIRCGTGLLRQGGDLVPGLSGRLNALAGTASQWRLTDWCRALAGGVPTRYAERLTELIEHHGVTDCMRPRIEHLSGGQRQRVALVRALLGDPGLLLADEPTAGLDRVTAAAAVDAVHRSAAVTVLVATHDLTVAAQFPHVIALREGRLVHDGAGIDERQLAELYAAS